MHSLRIIQGSSTLPGAGLRRCMRVGAQSKREPQRKDTHACCTQYLVRHHHRWNTMYLHITDSEARALLEGHIESTLKFRVRNKLITSVAPCPHCGHRTDHYSVCPKYVGSCSCGNPNDYHYNHNYNGAPCFHHGRVDV